MAVAVVLAVASTAAPGAGVAASEDLLERTIVDAAFVDRGDNLSPDLLTIESSPTIFGGIRVRLLRRNADWTQVDEAFVPDLHAPFDDSAPWLVDLGEGRFAVLVASPDQPLTDIWPVLVDATRGDGALRVGASIDLELTVTYAGAADVAGDGSTELVIAGEGDPARCSGTQIAVLGGFDPFEIASRGLAFQSRSAADVGHRLGGAVLGEWDGRPGADLLAYAYDTCPPDPNGVEPKRFLATRLADFSTIVDIPAVEPESEGLWPSFPLSIDVDGDGRHEAVLSLGGGVSIADPADGWRLESIAGGDRTPIVAVPAPFGEAAGFVAWMGPIYDPRDVGVGIARIARVDGSLTVTGRTRLFPDFPPNQLIAAVSRVRTGFLEGQPPQAWTGDANGDDCADLLAPLIYATCLGVGPVVPGSAWFDTRPLGVVGQAQDRRLLVAQGLEWFPYEGGPLAPNPAAAWAPGAWRRGPSKSFVLAEVPLPPASPAPSARVDPPAIDTTVSSDGMIDMTAPTGTRLLVRAIPSGPSADPLFHGFGLDLDTFLRSDAKPGEWTGMIRVPVAVDGAPGTSIGSVPFEIRAYVTSSDGSSAEEWIVSAVVVDESGEVSSPAEGVAVFDVIAPPLSLEAPLLNAPWPFEAAVGGSSESGASVRIGDGPLVAPDAAGKFELRTQLAPWPQTLEVTAVDAFGNATTAQVSVMGGLDIRQLPWPAILALAVIAAAALGSLRGGRRAPTRASPVTSGDDVLSVIEDVSSGPIERRD
jgi:hypothetical protein